MAAIVALQEYSNQQLIQFIARCEQAIFAGTSTHHDVLLLIDSERELKRREQERLAKKRKLETRLSASRTSSGTEGALVIQDPDQQ